MALLYASYRDLSRREARLLSIAGLLHDVGHGPLSHTLEPIFREQFGISHHDVGAKIIRGELPIGSDIPKMLARRGVDADEVNAMIDGSHHAPHAFLFSGPINLDMIEGIARCHVLYGRGRKRLVSAANIVRELAAINDISTPTFDIFWQLEHDMYNRFIHNRIGLLFDGLAQAFMHQNVDEFLPSDFFKDEVQ